MRVLIVSRTRMRGSKCIGGLVLSNNQSVRLLTASGTNQSDNSAYQVGQIWDLTFTPSQNPAAPHTEDVLVTASGYISDVSNLVNFLDARIGNLAERYWEGSPDCLFRGMIRSTGNGSGFIAHPNVPNLSTGFWRPDRDLIHSNEGTRVRYTYPGNYEGVRVLTYVGDTVSIPIIPAGSLVRVSLARWWRPQGAQDLERRCYLQLSGWYL
jgi:hypothetical protein